jgi:hypothetical protein
VKLHIKTTDASGKPVKANVGVAVVDDTVLAYADDKSGNAAGRELASSLWANRQEAVRGVAFPRNRPTMASKIRRAVNLLATR